MSAKIDPKVIIGFSDLIKQFYFYRRKELQPLGVKLGHCKMLHLLSDHGGVSQQEIASLVALSRSTISEILTEMVNQGYIERRSSKEDRRLSLIYLTDVGQEKAQAIRRLFEEFCDWCMRDFDEQEVQQFSYLLHKFRFH